MVELEKAAKPLLLKAGWDGQYCVRPYFNFTFDKITLAIRINKRKEYRIYGPSELILQNISQLGSFASDYKVLSDQLESLQSKVESLKNKMRSFLQESRMNELSAGHEAIVQSSNWQNV